MGGKVGRQAKKAMELFGLDKPLLSHFAVFGFVQPLSGGGLSGKITVDDWTDWTPERTAKKAGWTVMMDSDPLKLTIFTGEKGYRGREVAEILRAHEVECEFADLDAVVLTATPENTERDFQRIEKALERLPQKEKIEPHRCRKLPKQKMRIREAIFGRWEEISCEEAVGRICASPCVSCPPAIPIAASGEEITAELLPLFGRMA